MGALKKNFDTAEVVVKSIKAGVDMFIHTAIKYSDHIKLLNKTTEILTKDIKALVAMEKAYQRVIKMKNRVLEKYYK
jgi:beta-glucosidase-like glycosyl hydrolase